MRGHRVHLIALNVGIANFFLSHSLSVFFSFPLTFTTEPGSVETMLNTDCQLKYIISCCVINLFDENYYHLVMEVLTIVHAVFPLLISFPNIPYGYMKSFSNSCVQGPLAAPTLQHLTKDDLSKIYFGDFRVLDINGAKCFLTRTGYVFLLVGFGIKLSTYLEL